MVLLGKMHIVSRESYNFMASSVLHAVLAFCINGGANNQPDHYRWPIDLSAITKHVREIDYLAHILLLFFF